MGYCDSVPIKSKEHIIFTSSEMSSRHLTEGVLSLLLAASQKYLAAN